MMCRCIKLFEFCVCMSQEIAHFSKYANSDVRYDQSHLTQRRVTGRIRAHTALNESWSRAQVVEKFCGVIITKNTSNAHVVIHTAIDCVDGIPLGFLNSHHANGIFTRRSLLLATHYSAGLYVQTLLLCSCVLAWTKKRAQTRKAQARVLNLGVTLLDRISVDTRRLERLTLAAVCLHPLRIFADIQMPHDLLGLGRDLLAQSQKTGKDTCFNLVCECGEGWKDLHHEGEEVLELMSSNLSNSKASAFSGVQSSLPMNYVAIGVATILATVLFQ